MRGILMMAVVLTVAATLAGCGTPSGTVTSGTGVTPAILTGRADVNGDASGGVHFDTGLDV